MLFRGISWRHLAVGKIDCFNRHGHMGVSNKWGYPNSWMVYHGKSIYKFKWMVYNGKSIYKFKCMVYKGVPLFQETSTILTLPLWRLLPSVFDALHPVSTASAENPWTWAGLLSSAGEHQQRTEICEEIWIRFPDRNQTADEVINSAVWLHNVT